MKVKPIYLYLLFILIIGIIIIGCDNSGSSIFGNFEDRERRERSITESVLPARNISNQETHVSDNVSDLIFVAGGSFHPAADFGEMTISPFHIGKYEITRAEYYKIMGEKPWLNEAYDPYSLSDIFSEEDIERIPATGMNWFEAIVFCNRLSIRENLTPVYTLPGKGTNPDNWGAIPGTHSMTDSDSEKTIEDSHISLWNRIEVNWNANGYRLPTEMEFLWAALGGTNTQDREFSGDTGLNHINDYAWHIANSGNNPHPVGRKNPNALGLFDMTGNVMEWCWDITGIAEEIYNEISQDRGDTSAPPLVRDGIALIRLPKEDHTDYRGAGLPDTRFILDSMAIQRAVAGGSWATSEEKSSLAYRESSFPESRFPEDRDTRKIGFRVVRR
ncbi:MAG: formylglycine-generating enzyme family protein [Spirochaetaceae bacterium]|nr:formylglycine-generating enzyme family protein [Spirochaetaceae bacterium]